MQSHFRVEVRSEGRSNVIAVSGELDLASSEALERALLELPDSDTDQLIVDLRGLEFMDSTGLSILVRAHQRAEAAGRRFGLVRGSKQVQRLLDLTGFTDRLRIGDSPEELLNSD